MLAIFVNGASIDLRDKFQARIISSSIVQRGNPGIESGLPLCATTSE